MLGEPMNTCNHPSVKCINPYELIRKYICDSCNEVMMCACEEEFASQYLSHQLSYGTELHTNKNIPVTLGFVKNTCNTCRGLPEEVYPKAQLYGKTSKIYRYYWREIAFKTIPKFDKWAKEQKYINWLEALIPQQKTYNAIEREVVDEFKELHKLSPKYSYCEESAEELLTKLRIEIIKLDGIYKKVESGIAILDGEKFYSPEEFTARHFEKLGYKTLFTESIPFHVLFGIFLWLLIQEPNDPNLQMIGFGDRISFESKEKVNTIYTLLPLDFGTSIYSIRRAVAIERHFALLPKSKEELIWTFDYWIEPSADLRQYLWAHRLEDIAKAREIVSILPPEIILKILRYLLGDYWHRYCGWPDLLVYRQEEFIFVEVKSSNDRLSENQKNWIRGNCADLHLPFKIVKIHKKAEVM